MRGESRARPGKDGLARSETARSYRIASADRQIPRVSATSTNHLRSTMQVDVLHLTFKPHSRSSAEIYARTFARRTIRAPEKGRDKERERGRRETSYDDYERLHLCVVSSSPGHCLSRCIETTKIYKRDEQNTANLAFRFAGVLFKSSDSIRRYKKNGRFSFIHMYTHIHTHELLGSQCER